MAGWLEALGRTRRALGAALARVFARPGAPDAATLEQLEESLLAADVPVRLAGELLGELRQAGEGAGRSPRERLRARLLAAFADGPSFVWQAGAKPLTVLLVGVNGSGKTTTAAKLARAVQQAGLTPLLGATDTFRAAGSEQLKLWADRLKCDVVAGTMGADAAAVAYDALAAALARGADALILDTAGRMHTRQPLMEELRKIRGALAKRRAGAPDETWIVLDATLGSNAVTQARVFHQAVPLSGVIVTKLDGSSKGGFVFSISREMQLPIRYVGLGEGPDDLASFDREHFVDALLGSDGNTPSSMT